MKAKRAETGNKENQQRSDSNRVLKSQDQSKSVKELSNENKQVSPFELFPTNRQANFNLAELRKVVRNELEIVDRERQINGSQMNIDATLRDLKMELAQVKHLLNSKTGETKGLETYVNSRLQHLATEAQNRHESLKNSIAQLEKKSNERLLGLQVELQSMESRYNRETRSAQKQTVQHSRLNVLESNIEELFHKLKTPISTVKVAAQNMSDSFIAPSDIEKELRSFRNEYKMTMTSLNLQMSSMEEDLETVSRELKKKANVNDISETIEELREGIKQQVFGMEAFNESIESIRKEYDQMSLRVFNTEDSLAGVYAVVQGKQIATRKAVEDHMQSLSDSFETKLGRIVTSYNLNFQEIDINCEELRTMLSEVLNINSTLTSRLLGIVTHKIDSSAFQSTIETLNEQISEELFVNNRRLQEIGEKEFEVEHELKSLKEILEGLRNDYQRNYNRIRLDDDRSCCSARKNVQQECLADCISPKDAEQIMFKKGETPSAYDCLSSLDRRIAGKQRSNLSRSIREPSSQRLSDELAHLV